MNRVHTISIETIMKDAYLTPSTLLERINSIAEKQLLTNIKERKYNEKTKQEYFNKHIKEYKMSRATLYNILKSKKASRRKFMLIKQTLDEIIKERNLYKDLDIEIGIEEY